MLGRYYVFVYNLVMSARFINFKNFIAKEISSLVIGSFSVSDGTEKSPSSNSLPDWSLICAF